MEEGVIVKDIIDAVHEIIEKKCGVIYGADVLISVLELSENDLLHGIKSQISKAESLDQLAKELVMKLYILHYKIN